MSFFLYIVGRNGEGVQYIEKKENFYLRNIMGSLIIKKCIVGTLALGLAGSGTNKFSAPLA